MRLKALVIALLTAVDLFAATGTYVRGKNDGYNTLVDPVGGANCLYAEQVTHATSIGPSSLSSVMTGGGAPGGLVGGQYQVYADLEAALLGLRITAPADSDFGTCLGVRRVGWGVADGYASMEDRIVISGPFSNTPIPVKLRTHFFGLITVGPDSAAQRSWSYLRLQIIFSQGYKLYERTLNPSDFQMFVDYHDEFTAFVDANNRSFPISFQLSARTANAGRANLVVNTELILPPGFTHSSPHNFAGDLRPVIITVPLLANVLRLSWPVKSDRWFLQSTEDLASTNAWLTVTNTPSVSGGQATLDLPFSGSRRFFQLRKDLSVP